MVTMQQDSGVDLDRFGLDPATGILVGGEWLAAHGGATFDVEDPASRRLVARVADGGTHEATSAVDSAAQALPAWQRFAPRERSEILRRAFTLMVEEIDRLAVLITIENGKAISDARGEVAYAAEFFRWYAEECVRTDGGFGDAPAGGARTITTRRPVGVAALVTPWNFPAAMATRKIAPALAAGCTVVLKPAAETPLTALAVASILEQAGVPPGVVNVVPTTDAPSVVGTWLADPRVRKLSFTGSTAVGRMLLQQSAARVVNTSMELGGNAPFIVTDDADLDAAVAGAMVAKFRNAGQACTAANRFYVHAEVAAEFTARFGRAVAGLRVGPGISPDTQIGPLVSSKAVGDVRALVADAVAGGAVVAHESPVPTDTDGHYFPPTVLSDVPSGAQILRTEVFGPVAPVVSWTDDAQLLDLVNATEYGLAAYVYSRDLQRAIRLSEQVDAGMVGINRGIVSDPSAPFGGVKQSGLGREGAREGMQAFQETQYLSVDWP